MLRYQIVFHLVIGPVQATYMVYSDFMNYESGVYIHSAGSMLGRNNASHFILTCYDSFRVVIKRQVRKIKKNVF